MKNLFEILLIVSTFFFSCIPNENIINRKIVALDSKIVMTSSLGVSSFRNFFCDIYLKNISVKEMKAILQTKLFLKSSELPLRIPPFNFFYIAIKNNWDRPMAIDKITVSFQKKEINSLDCNHIKNIDKEDFKYIDCKDFFSYRRILRDTFDLSKIDLKKDTLLYKINFIPSKDSVIKIFAIPWIPAEIKKFKMHLYLNFSFEKKRIDLDMVKINYREKKILNDIEADYENFR